MRSTAFRGVRVVEVFLRWIWWRAVLHNIADTISRKWSLVVSHVLMGTAMMATGLVTDFGPLVATRMLWGLSWTFASGADVAWVTDELPEPGRISVVLMRSGRAQLTGAAAPCLWARSRCVSWSRISTTCVKPCAATSSHVPPERSDSSAWPPPRRN
jgi:MFS family permease